MNITTIRIPDPSRTAAFVLACAEARAAALDNSFVLLDPINGPSAGAYILHDEDGWHLYSATLFDHPAGKEQTDD